jgi:uncharacterized protein YecE (DUF72 family)
MRGRLFVGTSGYVYPHWRRRFYPRDLALRDWLPFYARHFATVELNNPFYRLPAAETFAAWRASVPAGFVFAVKASRFLTHLKRLKDPEEPLRRFLERARALRDTLGPVLFQLPARFHLSVDRLDGFLRALSRQRLVRRLRPVLEVRHVSWLEPEALARLRAAGMALCLADWHELPVTEPLTADFVYLRRHGTRARYGGSYTDAMLKADARRIRAWLGDGRDVYVYFNNDHQARAVQNARRLAELIEGSRRAPPRAGATAFTRRLSARPSSSPPSSSGPR